MTLNCTFEGLPKAVTVSTESALKAALINEPNGAVITLDTVIPVGTGLPGGGQGIELTVSRARRAPGISVVLPATQIAAVRFTGANLWTEILGGIWSKDLTQNSTASGLYSITIGGASHFSIRGATLSAASNIINGGSPSYFEVTNCLAEWSRQDIIAVQGARNFLIDDIYARDPVSQGRQILWWNNGTLPSDGVGNTANNTTSFWLDTAHPDLAQVINDSRDFRLSNFNVIGGLQGLVGFQGTESAAKWTRAEIIYNYLRVGANHSISAEGADVFVAYNDVGKDPGDLPSFTANFTMRRNPYPPSGPGTQPYRTGLNVLNDATLNNQTAADGGASLSATGAINGDTVAAPVLPNLPRMSWAPTPVRPAYVAPTVPIEIVIAPGIYYVSNTPPANPVLNDWLTVGLGRIKGKFADVTASERRWRRNGVDIGGATGRVYQVVALDIGASITCETRYQSAAGWSGWVATAAVTPV